MRSTTLGGPCGYYWNFGQLYLNGTHSGRLLFPNGSRPSANWNHSTFNGPPASHSDRPREFLGGDISGRGSHLYTPREPYCLGAYGGGWMVALNMYDGVDGIPLHLDDTVSGR